MSQFLTINIASENAVIVYLGDIATPKNSAILCHIASQLKQQYPASILNTTVSYHSLLIEYDFTLLPFDELTKVLNNQPLEHTFKHKIHHHKLPIYYGQECGPDFERLCDEKKLTAKQLITLHSEQLYHVYAIGFAPGFAFLGDLDKRLATPRLAQPRAHVKKGSLGIADKQTAIYPSDSPGGWNLIGRCPLNLFDHTKQPPTPFSIGDKVAFLPITRTEFIRLGGEL